MRIGRLTSEPDVDQTEPSGERLPLRILVVSPFPPRTDALHGGARAIAGLVVALARRNKVALLHLRAADEPSAGPELVACCDSVIEVTRDEARHGIGRWFQRARNVAGLLRGRPVWVSKWAAHGLDESLRRLIDDWKPDVIEISYEVMAPPGVPLVTSAAVNLTVYEPAYAAARDSALVGRFSPIARLDARAWERFTRTALRSVDAAVALTSRDEHDLRALGTGTIIRRIPLACPIPDEPMDPAGTGDSEIVFVGNYDHPPNRDAARWLAREVFPLVRIRSSGARLLLVGRGPVPVRNAFETGIHVLGEVPQIAPILNRAAVVVAPIRSGGGMRVKLLEAMAAGKATVATPRAAEGLAVESGRELMIAADAPHFAEAVLTLLQDLPLRVSMARSARAWAVANLDGAGSAAAYEEHFRQLLLAKDSATANP